MNNILAARKCAEYDLYTVQELVSEIYKITVGPEVKGKKVILKPNILGDHDPAKCITTHPVVVEAVTRFLQEEGAEVFIGDSPAIHLPGFKPVKSGIMEVCNRTGAQWVNFTENPVEMKLKNGSIKIAPVRKSFDLVFSLPKFKNHELVYFTGAIKNTLGFVPAFNKTKMHAIHYDRNAFSEFLVQLNEAMTPDYFLMDGIAGMQGPGPARGVPAKTEVLLGSTNPLALDIYATTIAGYDPLIIPTNRIALDRTTWLSSQSEIVYDGPAIEELKIKNFSKIPVSPFSNISVKFVANRIKLLRRFQRRPFFIHANCTGCHKCIKICPVQAIRVKPDRKKYIILTDNKCIRCFCCSEVCSDSAVEIRRKIL